MTVNTKVNPLHNPAVVASALNPGRLIQREAAIQAAINLEQDYRELRNILDEAFRFCAQGKGAERHGNGQPWREQHHFEIANHYGQGFALGQAEKKLRESVNLEDWKAARRELLGAITYIASAIFAGDQGID